MKMMFSSSRRSRLDQEQRGPDRRVFEKLRSQNCGLSRNSAGRRICATIQAVTIKPMQDDVEKTTMTCLYVIVVVFVPNESTR